MLLVLISAQFIWSEGLDIDLPFLNVNTNMHNLFSPVSSLLKTIIVTFMQYMTSQNRIMAPEVLKHHQNVLGAFQNNGECFKISVEYSIGMMLGVLNIYLNNENLELLFRNIKKGKMSDWKRGRFSEKKYPIRHPTAIYARLQSASYSW